MEQAHETQLTYNFMFYAFNVLSSTMCVSDKTADVSDKADDYTEADKASNKAAWARGSKGCWDTCSRSSGK